MKGNIMLQVCLSCLREKVAYCEGLIAWGSGECELCRNYADPTYLIFLYKLNGGCKR
ncbi:MAG: hypothetical protein QW738_00190 [Nitrososphaeria archaeon]